MNKLNEYDNLAKIKASMKITSETIKRIVSAPIKITRIDTDKAIIFYYHTVEGFLRSIYRLPTFSLPAWKVICPRLDNPKIGSIYYIVKSNKYSHVFRGTYGYSGTGCHESALIEKIFEKNNWNFAIRDGDYLLTILGVI